MAIGEFDGAATLSGDSGLLLSTPMYWLYEMGLAALNPSRAFADATRLLFKNPTQSAHAHDLSASRSPQRWNCSSARRAAIGRPDGVSIPSPSAASACRCTSPRLGAAVLPAAAFRAAVRASAAPAAAEAADRRADVGPLRHAAARHGRGLPAQSRRLHHRLGRRAHGAAGGRPLRSRRLHRLHHLHPADASAATPTWSRSASPRCRCLPRPR